MKILDIRKKGNMVLFYLGDEITCAGIDWNFSPYQKCSLVDNSVVKDLITVIFNFDIRVLQPHEQTFACYISKNNILQREYPLLILSNPYTNEEIDKIYMGDDFENINKNLIFMQYKGVN